LFNVVYSQNNMGNSMVKWTWVPKNKVLNNSTWCANSARRVTKQWHSGTCFCPILPHLLQWLILCRVVMSIFCCHFGIKY